MNLQENIHRIREVMGLNENEDRLNQILDKINDTGMESLSNKEKTFLYTLNKPNDTSEIEKYDYRIRVTTKRAGQFDLLTRLIESLLKKEDIESKVQFQLLPLGHGWVWNIYMKLGHTNPEDTRVFEILRINGFEITENSPMEEIPALPEMYHNKVEKYMNNATMTLTPKHGHNLTTRQEFDRIGKILELNGIKNRFVMADNDSYHLTLRQSNKEEQDKMSIIFSNKGYDVKYINK